MTVNNRLHLVLAIGFGLGVGIGAIGCSSSDDNGASEETLRIMVTNDDGVGAPGIDALVQALVADSRNEVVVSAPAMNSSGAADNTVEDTGHACADGTGDATEASTASGYATDVWAVDGCPADSVLYALDNLYRDEPPHVVLSGINEGQNVGRVVLTGTTGLLADISGTVGAAKTAACFDVPSLASSQGDVEGDGTLDYPSGVTEVLAWLEEQRAALLAGQLPVDEITSINIPSCEEVPLGTENPNNYPLSGPQDCESDVMDPPNDLEAFFNGFVSITPIPRNITGTCDKYNN
jgi:5'-nucleotidase